MKLSLTGYLLLALILSGAGNAFLGWRLAGKEARCQADMVKAASIAITNERQRAATAERGAIRIFEGTKAETGQAVEAEQGSTNGREATIRTVLVHGDCRMPAGLPSLQPAVDAANAAARN